MEGSIGRLMLNRLKSGDNMEGDIEMEETCECGKDSLVLLNGTSLCLDCFENKMKDVRSLIEEVSSIGQDD